MQAFRDITYFYVLFLSVVGNLSDQQLPIVMTRLELAKIKGEITIQFKNIPKVADTYWTHGENGKSIGSGSVAGDDVEIEMMPLPDENNELYVTLTTKDKKWCATRLIVKLSNYLQPRQRFQSSKIEDIEVDWRGSCEAKADIIGPVYVDAAKLYMMADDFDDGTTVVCCSYMLLDYTYEIELCNTESYTVAGRRPYPLTKKFYNESTEFPNWCAAGQHSMVFTQDKIIKKVEDYIKYSKKYTFTKKDNGSILYCLYFRGNGGNYNKPQTFTRVLDKKFMISYNENKDQHPTAPVTPPPQTTPKPTPPPPAQLYAGINITYSCSGNNDPQSQIRWTQLFRINGQKIPYPYLNGTKYNLLLSTVEEFDNNSTLTCYNKRNSRISYQIINITLVPPTSRTSTTSDIPIIPYNEETEVEYNCWNHNIDYIAPKYYIILINGKSSVKVLNETKQTFSQSDNSSILACMFIRYNRKESKVIRNVRRKRMLVYTKSKKADVNASGPLYLTPASKSDMEDSVTAHKYFYYLGGALFVALILMLIILWNFKKSRSRRPRPSPEAKEDRNANTGQVTYAELSLRLTSKEFRRPIGDESPYAELANLNQETYENLRITEDCRWSAVEESPYVEITQSTQGDFKERCKNT